MVEIKNYNVMIDGQNSFDQPVKNDVRKYEIIRKKTGTRNGDEYTTSDLLDYSYFKENYQIIAIDHSRVNNK